VLSSGDLVELLQDQFWPSWGHERQKLDRIDRWYRWDPDDIRLPRTTTPELKALRELSRVPWLGLVVTSTAQCMFVDGYRSALDPVGKPEDIQDQDGPWSIWQANKWNVRQNAVHRAMLAYGYAYATCLPGEDPITGDSMPVLRGVSPRKMWAVYEDPAEDDWPKWAMRVVHQDPAGQSRVKIFDDQFVYSLSEVKDPGANSAPWVLEGVPLEHGIGVCPVVRYTNQLDLDGRTPGEIEPHIPIASRINKTSYDRMLVQHYNSWKVRYVTGMAEPDTDETAILKKLKLRQDDLLIAEDPDTRFGTLDETQLAGFIAAHEADVETLAAVTQTPTHELTGKLINVSAEGLAMIRASQQQKVYERQQSAGAAHAQLLRLAAAISGDEAHAKDITGRVTWQDTSIRSLAQSVDALGKAATMLQIPLTALWGRIPGVEKSDVEEWIELAEQHDPINQLSAQLNRQAAADVPPPADPNPSGSGYAA
jgi:hypothetical protein